MTQNQPAAPAWVENLRPGSILLFRFPERHDDLAGKRRPCLVLGTRSGPDDLWVSLAYGTSVDTDANRGFDFSVEGEDCTSAGIHRPTRFVLARRITVKATDLRFDLGEDGNPIIGMLPSHRVPALNALTCFLADRVFEDSIPRPYHKPSLGRRHRQSSQAHARTVSDRREITTPMRPSRGSRCKPTRTVIVEHRRKRATRPTSSAA